MSPCFLFRVIVNTLHLVTNQSLPLRGSGLRDDDPEFNALATVWDKGQLHLGRMIAAPDNGHPEAWIPASLVRTAFRLIGCVASHAARLSSRGLSTLVAVIKVYICGI